MRAYGLRPAAILACALVLASAARVPVYAQTAMGSLNPSLTISVACISTGGSVSFPEYLPNSPVAVTAAGTGATLTCTNNIAWSITASKGNYSSHAGGTCGGSTCSRAMYNSTSGTYIGYDLFVGACCSGTTVWNTTNKISGYGTGAAQAVTFWGMVAASQNVAAGTYTDTVVATYTF
jgi:spore coat protein U-like protein